jgi:hypothetical protein
MDCIFILYKLYIKEIKYMAKGLLASVANVDLFDNNNNLIVSTKTLTDSGINMAISNEEARGGQSN